MINGPLNGIYQVSQLVGHSLLTDDYIATDLRTNVSVVVKILRAEFARQVNVASAFLRRARVVQSLVDANIVRLLDVGEDNGIYYVVYERADGSTLAHLLELNGKSSLRDGLLYTRQLMSALQAAHARGITHGEIGPQSVVVTDNGVAKVTDFGIAGLHELTDTTVSAGDLTVGDASLRRFDPHRDLHGVAATLFELLSGRPPYDQASLANETGAPANPEPMGLSAFSAAVPLPVLALIARGLGNDPTRRFQSASAMLQALDQLVQTYCQIDSSESNFIQHARKALSPIIAAVIGTRTGGSEAATYASESQRRNWLSWAFVGLVAVITGALTFYITTSVFESQGSSPKSEQPPAIVTDAGLRPSNAAADVGSTPSAESSSPLLTLLPTPIEFTPTPLPTSTPAALPTQTPTAIPTATATPLPPTATAVPIIATQPPPTATRIPPTRIPPTPTPTPYAVSQYPQQDSQGQVWLVTQWSDGTFTQELVPATPTPLPTDTPTPTATRTATATLVPSRSGGGGSSSPPPIR